MISIEFYDENDKRLFSIGCERDKADEEVALQIQAMADAGLDVDKVYAYCDELDTNWDFEGVSDHRVIVGKDDNVKPRIEFLAHMVKMVKPAY